MKKFIMFLLLAVTFVVASAQISDRTKSKLRRHAFSEYKDSRADGCNVYQTKDGYVLVTVVTVNKEASDNNQILNRKAQLLASRSALEFLNGARNESVTTYVIADNPLETSKSSSSDNESDEVELNIDETIVPETTVSKTSFSDRIIQSAIGNINRMQCLKRTEYKGDNVFLYYRYLSKVKKS